MAATGWPVWRAPYEPLAGGFVHLHTPDPYRPPFLAPPYEATPEAIADAYLRLVEETIELEGPRTIAALITEPVLMSAGVVIPPARYLPGLRELCDRHGILLIFDEIITAFGRLGAMFASELFETWADIVCLGKGLCGRLCAAVGGRALARGGGAVLGRAARPRPVPQRPHVRREPGRLRDRARPPSTRSCATTSRPTPAGRASGCCAGLRALAGATPGDRRRPGHGPPRRDRVRPGPRRPASASRPTLERRHPGPRRGPAARAAPPREPLDDRAAPRR